MSKQHDRNQSNQDLTVNGQGVSRRAFIGYLSGALAATTLMGSSSAWGQSGGAARVLQVGANANPSSLDPAIGGSGADHVFLYPLFDTLVAWDFETLKAEPGLAEKWEFTDSKTLVLTIRKGVQFHDGTPLNAKAVKINLDRNRGADVSNIRADLGSVKNVTVTDDHQVTLTLKNPDTALPLILSDRAGMMVSPAALEKHGGRVDRNPVGAGFMRLNKWDDGSKVAMTRFDDYYGEKSPSLDGIEFKIITDSSTRLRAVMSGQADIAYSLDGRQKPMLEKMPTVEGTLSSTLYVHQFYMNMAREPMNDVRVRQAINHAIDRKAFIRATMAGAGEPAYMNLPQSHWAFDPETAELYPYDPEKAKQLLAEAGYPDGIELDLRGYNDQSSVQMQEVLLDQFAKVGIRGRFRTGTVADLSVAYFGQEKSGDMLLSAWTGRPDPSLSYSLMYTEDAYYNAGSVAPPEGFDEALLASRREEDLDQRKAALAKVQRLVMENALVAPLAFRQSIVASSDKVSGYRNNLLGKPKFEGVSLKG